MKKLLTLIIVVFSIHQLSASESPQMPDYLIYKGDTLAVYSLILEKYFDNLETPHKGSLFDLKFRDGASFNCWRGYQAIYSIENDHLFLNSIIDCGELFFNKRIDHKKSMSRLHTIFGYRIDDKNRVFIDWYTGDLSLPRGDVLRWDGVFHKSFEKETLISIEEGKVISNSDIENYIDDPNRIDRRYNDKIVLNLFEELKLLDWEELSDNDCEEEYIITIGEDGTIKKVSMFAYKEEEIEEYWDRGEYDYCVKGIKNGLSKLKFDIIKLKGKEIEEKVYIELRYDEKNKMLRKPFILD